MRVLAVDTTSAFASLAVLNNGLLEGFAGAAHGPRHSERLLPALDRLLSDLELSVDGIDGFAVSVGPGSFTGLRIGIASVEGLAFATGRPCAGVSALDATAHRYRYRPGWIAVVLDAYRGEIYGATYRSNDDVVSMVEEPVCEAPERFVERLPREPVLFAGTGVRRVRTLAKQRFGGNLVVDDSFFIAEEVARIGWARLLSGETDELGELRALYVRPSEAEIARSKREAST